MSEEVTFSQLDSKVQSGIKAVAEVTYQQIKKLGKEAWANLCGVLLHEIKQIDFARLAKALPAATLYHRIPYVFIEGELAVVMFVFKSDFSDKSAILVHVYSDPFPNKDVYAWEQVVDKPVKNQEIKQTLPHSHRVSCYSCVAWMEDGVEVVEEVYVPCVDGKIKLIEEHQRKQLSCNFDDAEHGGIHSVSVYF